MTQLPEKYAAGLADRPDDLYLLALEFDAFNHLVGLREAINRKTAPHSPSGWGKILPAALSECVKAINRLPYEGHDGKSAGA